MNPYRVSAQFTAYHWFLTNNACNSNQAMRFARHNWAAFLTGANQGLGRLLIRVATPPGRSRAA
jgi:hypothetical protein